jgi:hypothetical protein
MKRLIIRVPGNQSKPIKLKIRRGTTARDILSHLQLDERYVLSPVSDLTKVFSAGADVYAQVMDRERLAAGLSPEAIEAANKYILSFFKKEGEI